MTSIFDRSFRYTKSFETDLKKSFARIRREQRKRGQAEAGDTEDATSKVLTITQRKKEAAR